MQKNILIIYGSTTGNSEKLATHVEKYLKPSAKITIKNVMDLEHSFNFCGYDLYILVTSTWGIEPACLQEDFAYFWQHLNKSVLTGKAFVILGLGDSYYPHFAHGVDILTADILTAQGVLLAKGLKIQDHWEQQTTTINKYLAFLL